MKILSVILILYLMFVGFLGGIALYVANPYDNNAYKWFWNCLKNDFNIIGCIIIYIILFPAIVLTIITDIFCRILSKICDLFYMIFGK